MNLHLLVRFFLKKMKFLNILVIGTVRLGYRIIYLKFTSRVICSITDDPPTIKRLWICLGVYPHLSLLWSLMRQLLKLNISYKPYLSELLYLPCMGNSSGPYVNL